MYCALSFSHDVKHSVVCHIAIYNTRILTGILALTFAFVLKTLRPNSERVHYL